MGCISHDHYTCCHSKQVNSPTSDPKYTWDLSLTSQRCGIWSLQSVLFSLVLDMAVVLRAYVDLMIIDVIFGLSYGFHGYII